MKKKISEVFGIKAPDTSVIEVNDPGVHTPAIEPDYVFRPALVRVMLLWLAGVERNLYLTGPTSAGKSSLVEQVAARLGLNVFRVACQPRLDWSDLVGRFVLTTVGDVEEGKAPATAMQFVYGPLVEAMLTGSILLLDEVDLLPPATSMGLNSVLDGAALFLPETGERIEAHPSFRIACTGNTAGGGDPSGAHRGTVRQNIAWMDRYIVATVDYMAEEDEVGVLLKKAPGLPKALAESMVKVGTEIRKLFLDQGSSTQGERMDITLSTRTLVRWAKLTAGLRGTTVANPVHEAFALALLNRASPEVRQALEGIAIRVMGPALGI